MLKHDRYTGMTLLGVGLIRSDQADGLRLSNAHRTTRLPPSRLRST
jgi:hypothetical protein